MVVVVGYFSLQERVESNERWQLRGREHGLSI